MPLSRITVQEVIGETAKGNNTCLVFLLCPIAGFVGTESHYSSLYKASFDNMAAYLQRKEERLQQQKKKRQDLQCGSNGQTKKMKTEESLLWHLLACNFSLAERNWSDCGLFLNVKWITEGDWFKLLFRSRFSGSLIWKDPACSR